MVKSSHQINPPRFARVLLRIVTPAVDRAVILGDLDEGFHEKLGVSAKKARQWYWQQTLKSMPYLFWRRLSSDHIKAIGAILLVTFMGYVFIHLWDVFAARKTAQYVARTSPSLPLDHIRKLYFLLYMVGATVVGSIIASTLFSKYRNFAVNVVLCIGPVAAVIFTDSFMRFLLADTPNALTYFLQRIGLAYPALIFGAFIWMRLRRVPDK